MPFLFPSFEENSIPWVILTGGVGALLGASFKFIFDNLLGPTLESSRAARAAMRKYSYPLLRAAEALDRRLENLFRHADKKWFDDPKDDYYRISTLYLFGCYFGWCNILEKEAFLEYVESDKKARDFSTQFYRVFKGITGFYYFEDLLEEESISAEQVEAATVPRLALTAIGELMVKSPAGKDTLPSLIDFVEFAGTFAASDNFQRWFAYLIALLTDLEHSRSDPRWNRLLVFATNLRTFVSFLDPAHRQTRPRYIYYLPSLHPRVEARLRKELEESGHADLIAKPLEVRAPV